MGSAYTALATDAYAPVWNPAGLAFVTTPELTGQHLSYLESINYEHLGFAHPLGPKMGIGFAAQYLGSGSMTETDNIGNQTGSFSSHYAAGSLAWARKISNRFSFGVTGKWITAAISDLHANAYAADFGSLWKVSEHFNLAATLTNFGTPLKFVDQADNLPMATHLAAAWRLPVFPLTTSAEAVYERAGLLYERFGLEYKPAAMFAIRAGYRTDTINQLSAMAGLTAGAGLTLWGQEFSYAWVPLGDLGNTQYFSMTLRFGKDEERRRNLIYYAPSNRRIVEEQNQKEKDVEFLQLMQLINATGDETKGQRAQAPTPVGNPK
jgi:hypothetical protein